MGTHLGDGEPREALEEGAGGHGGGGEAGDVEAAELKGGLQPLALRAVEARQEGIVEQRHAGQGCPSATGEHQQGEQHGWRCCHRGGEGGRERRRGCVVMGGLVRVNARQ
jgi:hypothetical protein